jgi:hypothetical protein
LRVDFNASGNRANTGREGQTRSLLLAEDDLTPVLAASCSLSLISLVMSPSVNVLTEVELVPSLAKSTHQQLAIRCQQSLIGMSTRSNVCAW